MQAGSPYLPPQAGAHLWWLLEGLAVEAAYPSALQALGVSCIRLIGLALELGTVAGLVSHLIIRGLVLRLGFYWLHGLDVRPRSELIPVGQRKCR